jgi:ring-1,2-phenylacetyl-CoA epoxidase subunit PaaE
MADTAGRFVPLEVTSVGRLTPDSVVVGLRNGDPPFGWTAGQHLVLRRLVDGQELRRTYSICASAARPDGELRIAVKRLEGGAFSEWVNGELRPGDVIEAMAPKGRFTPRLDPAVGRRYVAIAAGSGITPVFSIVSTVLEVEPLSTVALWYGNRTTEDVMFLEEICDLKDRFTDRFEALFFMSREEQEIELFNGRLDGVRVSRLLAEMEPPERVDGGWYLCGPFEMVTELRRTLLDAGVDPALVHLELFHVDGEVPRAAREARAARLADAGGRVSSVSVALNGRVTRLSVPFDGEPVLDALTRGRSDAPYSCKSGVCGTCRARLVAGAVEMDLSYALDGDEAAEGYVLMCQSHPTTDEVRLEVE